jgi:hypothetical protein
LEGPLQDRELTASERIYKALLYARSKKERTALEGQLVAICIAACRTKHFAPPYEWHEYYDWHEYPKHGGRSGRWVGGPFSLPSWVRDWVSGELSGEPLKDGARYIGRRCVNALIDKIRWHKRRKRGAQERSRAMPEDTDPTERQWSRTKVRRAFAEMGLPGKIPIEGDRELFERLVAQYPKKLTNVAIARALGVSEGAIRKRRKRISRICFCTVKHPYLQTTVFKTLGLKQGYEK